jgi:deoxyribose-phosphate aldolase
VDDRDVIIRCLDLTSLRGDETEDDIAVLCDRAAEHRVAAVVVYPSHVAVAKKRLNGTHVRVATVAGDFPSGTASLDDRLFDVRRAADAGPDEIDVVIDRRHVIADKLERVRDEVAMMREIAANLTMKVILETAELQAPQRIRAASLAACVGGADFVKSSTGKAGPVTTDAALAMIRAIRAFAEETGNRVGIKVAGGIRTADDALAHVGLVRAELGEDWLTPGLFRIGASSLLDDLLRP